MKNFGFIFFILLFLVPNSFAQDGKQKQFVLGESLPQELSSRFYQNGFYEKFQFNDKINPFYLRADFNGDDKMDYAISVSDKKTKKIGIAIFTSLTEYQIIGAGNSLSNRDMDDFSWMDAWYVYDKKRVDLGVGETEVLKLNSDAIMAIQTESASGIIYWNGQEYLWYQQGD